jgi:uncharacterized protein (DUF58 family)
MVKTTKEGRRSFMAMLLVALAALNTGNNLIYLTMAMMAAIFALSVVLLVWNLRGLSLDVAAPRGPVFASSETFIGGEVRNEKGRLPSFSIRVRGLGAEGIIPRISPGEAERAELRLSFKRRGLVRLGGFTLASSFPFIFLELSRKVRIEEELLVYPEIFDIGLSTFLGGTDGKKTLHRRSGDEMHHIREYLHGDDMRRVSWKASARHDRLMVKDLASEEAKTATIVLDGTGPSDPEAFEKAVSLAASAADLLIRKNCLVRLVTPEEETSFGTGREHLFRMLAVLALAREDASWGRAGIPGGGSVLVLKSDKSALAQRAGGFTEVVRAHGL